MNKRSQQYYKQPPKFPLMAVFLFASAALIGGGLLYGFVALKNSRPELVSTTLCPVEGPLARTVLLIDTSDQLTARQQASLDKLLDDFRDPRTSGDAMRQAGVPGGTRYIEPHEELVAYTLKRSDVELEPFLRVCNPGNPDDADVLGELTSSKMRVLARWQEFGAQITNQIGENRRGAELPNSPLLEAIALIVQREADSLATRESSRSVPMRLIVFSDMVQNSPLLSHFSELPNWDTIQQAPRFSPLAANLTSIEVVVYYLRRPEFSRVQTPAHFAWWREAVRRAGGRLIYMEPL